MLLVDSTVWVDYLTGKRSIEADWLDDVLSRDLVLVGDIILSEVLQGLRSDRDFERARRAFETFPQVSLVGPDLAIRSAINYRHLRRIGITVRKTIDCFIATYCITHDIPLLHNDRDFDHFEQHLGLPVLHPSGAP